MKTVAWDVYLWGKIIDTVFYTNDMTADSIYHSLVSHDGYDYHIEVRRA